MAENFDLSEMTWTEAEEALKERPVAILPVGSTQAQGPHMSLVADTFIAQGAARRGAAKLKERRIPAVILPPVHYSVTDLAADFPGTLPIAPETATALLRDICVAAARRCRTVVMVHLNVEPRHLDSVKKAVEAARAAGVSVCHTDFTKKRWAELLGEPFTKCEHAGAVKTSIMLAVAPGGVRDAVRISLAPVDTLQAALKRGAKTLAEAGAEDGYAGDPTAAASEDGEGYLETMAEAIVVTVMENLVSKA
jgi:creatinine amidohydrolase